MSNLKEKIVTSVLPIIKIVGKIEIEKVLVDVKSHNNTEIFKNTILGLHSNFSLLKEAAIRSSTKIDDGIIDLILEAVEERAAMEGISFP